MKVLVVYSENSGQISPFIEQQINSLESLGITINRFGIKGKGIIGYLNNFPKLIAELNRNKFDLIHAHYGLSGLLSNLQFKVPVITTFHGSDVNLNSFNKLLSQIAAKLSTYSIFVNYNIASKIKIKRKYFIIPCGVDLNNFYPLDKNYARNLLGFSLKSKLVLFSSNFDNKVKNYPLAKRAVDKLENVELLELKGYDRGEMNLLYNAADSLLVTSHSETGPLVVKEAMACNCPVVSVNVGDVKQVIGNAEHCYIVNYNSTEISFKLREIMKSKVRTNGRKQILGWDNTIVAKMIRDVYLKISSQKNY